MRHVGASNDDLNTILINVRRDVRRDTQGQQVPWEHSSLEGRFYFNPAAAAADPTKVTPARLSETAEVWAATKDSTSVVVLEAFAGRYKDTFYAELARARIEELKKQQVSAAKSDPTKKSKQPLTDLVGKTVELVVPKGFTLDDQSLKAGTVFRDCPECPEMVVVPAGKFLMGSPGGEGLGGHEGPQREVTIRKPFAVGKFEVTFAEWDACVASGSCTHVPGDLGWGRVDRPVINVSWNDVAKEFLPWLARRTGKPYRLLTEAEFEYAARGGVPNSRYWWGNVATHEYANYGKDECCDGLAQGRDKWEFTAPVGQFPPNPFGLHDMHGNVYEWVEDCYVKNYVSVPVDGSAAAENAGCRRMMRGASWNSYPLDLISSFRYGHYVPETRGHSVGFRVARGL